MLTKSGINKLNLNNIISKLMKTEGTDKRTDPYYRKASLYKNYEIICCHILVGIINKSQQIP